MLVESLTPSAVDDCPAAVFADQSKAFERISWDWIRRVLEGLGIPPWLRHAFLALVAQRVVVA
eukprot:4552145-Alexandrium_andersonii.AAC.1